MLTGALAGGYALGGGGRGVLRAVLQPLHHLALDRGADSFRGRHPQLVGRLLQLLLAVLVAGAAGALFSSCDHLSCRVGQRLGRGEKTFLGRRRLWNR